MKKNGFDTPSGKSSTLPTREDLIRTILRLARKLWDLEVEKALIKKVAPPPMPPFMRKKAWYMYSQKHLEYFKSILKARQTRTRRSR